ncbi:DUF3500 domain-containing protein [Luteipulveratus flavus]|uniref:DUF3500 domain-containing protein n=1 Tax=Luteipulveratus flavus TaxID=3031728 RepID=A0ABT6C3G5_9MICO|nr:DUF3500 domain-containing protein [Luteipulveratus sp. YIM 133296]MDF8263333.1 DUF3500 domain-containing protein [Luteipulveratus sp. YIM 133296]
MDPDPDVRRTAELVERLQRSLSPARRASATEEANDPERRRWTYLPGQRPGLPLAELDADQHALVMELLEALESGEGRLAVGAVEVERVRRTLAGAQPRPGDDRYWLRLIGSPGPQPWGWRVNGHHLAVHVLVVDGECSVTPHFIGSEPATLPSGTAWPGRRLLGPEEDLAHDLLASFEPDRRARAVASDRAPRDILTGADPVADPSVLPPGLIRRDMTGDQRALLDALVRRYLARAPRSRARAAWAAAEDEGLDRLAFAWAGSSVPGVGRYYCIHGPTLLIEYDNTQDDANHAHSVWRDLTLDWGEDLLRRHRASSH